MDKVAKLEAQLENGGTAPKKKSIVEAPAALRPPSQMMEIVDIKQLHDVKLDLRLRLQHKNVPS